MSFFIVNNRTRINDMNQTPAMTTNQNKLKYDAWQTELIGHWCKSEPDQIIACFMLCALCIVLVDNLVASDYGTTRVSHQSQSIIIMANQWILLQKWLKLFLKLQLNLLGNFWLVLANALNKHNEIQVRTIGWKYWLK